jgi:hypothetical protein
MKVLNAVKLVTRYGEFNIKKERDHIVIEKIGREVDSKTVHHINICPVAKNKILIK